VTAYDAIVIGAGQAGPYVTSRLVGAGMNVAVIERNAFGGTCVNTGCIPTKTMVASAYAARMAARAAGYGVDVGSVRVDMKRVMARKDAVSKTGCETWRTAPSTIHARFESAHEVYAKAPWTVIRRAMHIHPTVSELVPMLSDLRPMD
jgi:cation diffusion facilitator CzcD-associated flavoprotein CzcO